MTKIYAKTKWPPRKPAKPRPARAWLIHYPSHEAGFLHWIVLACSVEGAVEQAFDLPGDPGEIPQLGFVFDGTTWQNFTRRTLVQTCDICQQRGLLVYGEEELTWKEACHKELERRRRLLQ